MSHKCRTMTLNGFIQIRRPTSGPRNLYSFPQRPQEEQFFPTFAISSVFVLPRTLSLLRQSHKEILPKW